VILDREHRFWKTGKSVHDDTRLGVHDQSEKVFTLRQNGCSWWARICNLLEFKDHLPPTVSNM